MCVCVPGALALGWGSACLIWLSCHVCVSQVAEFVTEQLNYKESFVGPAAAILSGFIVLFWFVFVYAVTKINHNKR